MNNDYQAFEKLVKEVIEDYRSGKVKPGWDKEVEQCDYFINKNKMCAVGCAVEKIEPGSAIKLKDSQLGCITEFINFKKELGEAFHVLEELPGRLDWWEMIQEAHDRFVNPITSSYADSLVESLEKSLEDIKKSINE